jgi:hypothetical protein
VSQTRALTEDSQYFPSDAASGPDNAVAWGGRSDTVLPSDRCMRETLGGGNGEEPKVFN